MKKLIVFGLLVAGLINLYPVIGVVSVDQLVSLYDVPLENNDLIILMRHRAVLFGILGTLIIYAAVRETLQPVACVAGLVSMFSFIVLAYVAGDFGDAFDKIVIADVIGSIALVGVLVLRARQRSGSTDQDGGAAGRQLGT